MNQRERVKHYMDNFGSITTYEAFLELGVTKLSNRIGELRDEGVKIGQKTETRKNRYGDTCTYMRYWLKE